MGSFKALPCISNSKIVIMSCLARPQHLCHSTIPLSSLCGIGGKAGRLPAHNLRLRSFYSEAYSGKSKRSSSGHWGSESFRGDWVSSKVVACASSPRGSENGNGNAKKSVGGKDVEEILRKGWLVEKAEALEDKLDKPEICTADELHYVSVPGTNWRLALWRYRPPPNAPQRNHPVLMLSGIGTNAIGFDLDPKVSMARSIAGAGFDTWILEVRGSGLSKSEEELSDEGKNADGAVVEKVDKPPSKESSDLKSEEGTVHKMEDTPSKGTSQPTSQEMAVVVKDSQSTKPSEHTNGSATKVAPEDKTELTQRSEEGGASLQTWYTASDFSNLILKLSNKLSSLLTQGQSKVLATKFADSIAKLVDESTLSKRASELRGRLTNLLEGKENSSAMITEIAELRKKLAQLLEDGQDVVRPRVNGLQERLSSTVDDFQRIVDLIALYDWDFDNYLDEDVPTAMEYVRKQTNPIDGKLLSVGHSMGGIVLYATLSKRGEDSGLAGAVALASALDYQCSDTSLKLLLPLTVPGQALNVPAVPLRVLMTAVHPFITKPPYALAWLGYQVSAQNMMDTELFSKLVLNNFGTIPVKLLLHLATVFQPGGLASRDGKIKYKDNIGKITVPVLAIAGDQDLICPPVAVLDTVDLFPKDMITYKCFGGGENKRHYGHYDIVCSPGAKEEVFPAVVDFLLQHDEVKVEEEEKIEIGI